MDDEMDIAIRAADTYDKNKNVPDSRLRKELVTARRTMYIDLGTSMKPCTFSQS